MIGNLLQQFYNIADTIIVGQVLGANALAAVGSSYTLMVFLISIILGLCMGCGVLFSIQYGERAWDQLKNSIFQSLLWIVIITIVLTIFIYLFLDGILVLLQIPSEITPLMKGYLLWIFSGLFATFLFNYFASLLRSVGNSLGPLYFLSIASIVNVGFDMVFVMGFKMGVNGAVMATIIA